MCTLFLEDLHIVWYFYGHVYRANRKSRRKKSCIVFQNVQSCGIFAVFPFLLDETQQALALLLLPPP